MQHGRGKDDVASKLLQLYPTASFTRNKPRKKDAIDLFGSKRKLQRVHVVLKGQRQPGLMQLEERLQGSLLSLSPVSPHRTTTTEASGQVGDTCKLWTTYAINGLFVLLSKKLE